MAQTTKSQHKDRDKDTTKSSHEIENEIKETRGAITEDIKLLSDKFSPSHLKEEAKDAVMNAANAAVDKAADVKDVVVDKAIEVKDVVTEKAVELKQEAAEKLADAKDVALETLDDVTDEAKRFGDAAWRFTSANAVPLALVGLGAGWLIANSKREPHDRMLTSGYDQDSDYDYTDQYPGYDVVATESAWPSQGGRRVAAGRTSTPATSRGRSSRQPARAGSRRPQERASKLGAQAGSVAKTAQRKLEESASHGADYIRKSAAEGGEYLRTGFEKARDATRAFADENPLALAMATLAAGVGIGLLIPATDRETKLLRPARERLDRLVGDAREAATDVAHVARDTAKESVRALT